MDTKPNLALFQIYNKSHFAGNFRDISPDNFSQFHTFHSCTYFDRTYRQNDIWRMDFIPFMKKC